MNSILKSFDEALVRKLTKDGRITAGYCTSTDRTYATYMSNSSWTRFTENMTAKHKKQYDNGSGGELTEKNGRPPKMASFASSSQMIYRYSKDIESFIFEKKLPTTIGGTANLDGYLELEDRTYFVEAKCKEPYSHASGEVIKQAYQGIYAYLCEQMPDVFSCIMEKNNNRDMRVVFFCEGKEVHFFDIKQMICHLLAVGTENLKRLEQKEILFLYFLYNPTDLSIDGATRAAVLRIYDDTCWAAEHFNIKTMFGHVVDYLRLSKAFEATDDEAEQIKGAFVFRLCDQHNYRDFLDNNSQ